MKIAISGDTAPCESLVNASEGADLLICEGTYGDDSLLEMAEKYGHMTFSQAGRVACEAGVKRMWLTHFSQMMEEPQEYLQNAARFFPQAQCGEDGMSLTLRFENGETE